MGTIGPARRNAVVISKNGFLFFFRGKPFSRLQVHALCIPASLTPGRRLPIGN